MPSTRSTLGFGLLAYAGTAAALAANLSGTYHQFAAASYGLVATYNSGNFFNNFNFFQGTDPTHGWVNYLSQSAASSAGLINTNNGQIYLGVDYTTVNPAAPGRASVRVSSNAAYTHGLFIADIAHMSLFLRFALSLANPQLVGQEASVASGQHFGFLDPTGPIAGKLMSSKA
jgi:hypothetical protein